MIVPIVMAGGTGSRLWPLSRELHPKQFLRLSGKNSLLQETISRVDGIRGESPIVICNENHRFIVAEQLREIGKSDNSIILEPFGKNTAPAIALAALKSMQLHNEDEPTLLILAADHVIKDIKVFHDAILSGFNLAKQGKLVTFGIVPTKAETGYGYIKRGDSIEGTGAFTVDAFVEKPERSIAEKYVASKNYYWNSGMFIFKASRYLEELQKYRPDILSVCRDAIENEINDTTLDFTRIDHDIFKECPDESIDYAVMEKTTDAAVVPLDAEWDDIGSWSALWDINNKDESGNVISGDVFSRNVINSYINSDSRFVAAIGLENIVIVDTKDALLVINKSEVQDVKSIVSHLKNNNRNEFKVHRETFNPWGHNDKIVSEDRYVINRVTVKVGGSLSMQMHHHRTEHWVVLSGTAKVTINDKTFLLTENQSTFIPIGSYHKLDNPGKIPLEILEIQSGDYISPDDIVRL